LTVGTSTLGHNYTRGSALKTGPYYPLGTIGTVPRAYEGMEGRKNKNREVKNRKM
jgi:hypothetical protein